MVSTLWKGINPRLKRQASNKYFNVSSNDDMYCPPKQLMNQESHLVIVDDIGKNTIQRRWLSSKNTFVEDGNGWVVLLDNMGIVVNR